MVYGDFKDLPRRTASNKVLLDEAFNIAKSPKYDGYKRGLTSMIYNFYDKKPTLLARSETLATRGKSVSGGGVKKKLCQVGVLWT